MPTLLLVAVACVALPPPFDLSKAAVVVADTSPAPVAATVLTEEIRHRTGLSLPIKTAWPEGLALALLEKPADQLLGRPVPAHLRSLQAEGYGLFMTNTGPDSSALWIVGADKRGALFGVGKLLRMWWATEKDGKYFLERLCPAVKTSPAYPIRGHQLGYRATANSYDAWTVEQYDQYIRELAFFGTNCIENIPFQDDRIYPLMKMSRREMNIAISKICAKYDLDYCVWTPATFNLDDKQKRKEYLQTYRKFLKYSTRLDHIFFPGGDPGDNPPEKVMPFLEELYELARKYHPQVKIWISLQGFDKAQVDYFHQWVGEHMPAWLGGVVHGPSSPPIAETRARLPKQYPIRHYPDITHNKLCQYPVSWWDQAYAFTLGREAVNPRPVYYARVHNLYAPYTAGFLTYSDGVHDDVNKVIWSALGWEPSADVRRLLIEYSTLFFEHASAAPEIADAILALERNWEGPAAANGSVDSTLETWNRLEHLVKDTWRGQMCLLRANYDYYVRHRLIHEQSLERRVNESLADVTKGDADNAIDFALAILNEAGTTHRDARARIVDLCETLWQSIGLQTSVEKYQASGLERGAVLDFLDYPLNNRRWLEDELAKARAIPEPEKSARLHELAAWECPEPGSFYDSVGDISKSPHVIRGEEWNTDPAGERHPMPDWMWLEEGRTRVRQSWIGFMNWPIGLRYDGLDRDADYVIRETGYGECLLRADGQRLTPTRYGKETGEIKEFPVPRDLYQDGVIIVTFDLPDESHLNWRQQSRLNELWVIRKKP